MASPFTGTIGGRYALCGEIASGGMATVHLARQIGAAGFARIVAVKRLHERYSRDPEFVAMFLDEARVVSRIRHPNVVQTLDVVATESELFLVMDYVHGESLLRLTGMANKTSMPLPCRLPLRPHPLSFDEIYTEPRSIGASAPCLRGSVLNWSEIAMPGGGASR